MIKKLITCFIEAGFETKLDGYYIKVNRSDIPLGHVYFGHDYINVVVLNKINKEISFNDFTVESIISLFNYDS